MGSAGKSCGLDIFAVKKVDEIFTIYGSMMISGVFWRFIENSDGMIDR